ncbi:hypothetical protein Tco_0938944 [Tanacetum coccineum]|uniref:Uncharacterized protein n=1 Tax=Tanacetum coccineum TaxID=301880 RepID=A0ABQ5DJC6_9ASTR
MFDFWSIRTATTPIETNKPLVKDEDGEAIDVHVYRSMIGSLMYLTALRPDIMFAVCACARFQVTLKASYLNAVKRIFRYLKHQPKLGLWHPRDSPFELEAFLDSDYGGVSLDIKSTTGGSQFLGRRLISWQCKKQTIIANSTTEAEYVIAANCCGQVLWIQNQMMDYGFNFMNTKIHIDNESTISVIKNPVAHSRTKHIEIRFHFIRDCYEKRLIEVIKIHTDSNVADLLTKGFDVTRFNFLVRKDTSGRLQVNSGRLQVNSGRHKLILLCHINTEFKMANLRYSDKHNMVAFLKKPNESVGFTEIVDFLKGTSLRYSLTHNPTIYDSLVKQFWQTATIRTLANGIQELVASIDNKEYTITEASVRSKLQLADATGISNLPDAEIYDGLATLGPKSGGWDQFGSPIATALICLSSAAEDQGEGSANPAEPNPTPIDPSPTFINVADEATTTCVGVKTEGATTTTSGLDARLDNGNIHESPLRSHEAPLHEGHTSGSAEDSLQLQELMVLVPKLVTRIDNLEKELHHTKNTYGKAVLTLVERVKSLEVTLKTKTKKVVVSDLKDEEIENQGRKIQDIDDDPLVSLVRESTKEKASYLITPTKISASGEVVSQRARSTDKGKRYKRKTNTIDKDICTSLDAEVEVSPGRVIISSGSAGVNTGSQKDRKSFCMSPTVTDQMAYYVAPVAFGRTWTIMMIVAFRTQWLGLLSPWRSERVLILFVHTFLKLSLLEHLLKCPRLTNLITGVSSLIPSSSRIPTLSGHVAIPLAIPALYSTLPIVVIFPLSLVVSILCYLGASQDSDAILLCLSLRDSTFSGGGKHGEGKCSSKLGNACLSRMGLWSEWCRSRLSVTNAFYSQLEGTRSSEGTVKGRPELGAPLPPRPPHPSKHHHHRSSSDDSLS